MGYREELLTYVDEDGLVGARSNPGKWSTGNAILETALGYQILVRRGEAMPEDYFRFYQAIDRCSSANGLFNKNPGRPDEITHDDLIAAAAFSSDFAHRIVSFGRKNGWVLSNTGKPYPEAYARPWHITFYELRAGETVSLWSESVLVLKILENAYFNMDSASGKRLVWLMNETIKTK